MENQINLNSFGFEEIGTVEYINEDNEEITEYYYIDEEQEEEENLELGIEEDDGYGSGTDVFENHQLDTADDDGPGRSSRYKCNLCSRSFNTNRGLNIHKAAHKKRN